MPKVLVSSLVSDLGLTNHSTGQLRCRRFGQPRRELVAWIWAASILLELVGMAILGAFARLGEPNNSPLTGTIDPRSAG